MNYKKPAFWLIAAAIVACVIVAVCFLTDPKDKELYYHGQMIDADSLSDETIKWLRRYNGLSSEEQLSAADEIPDDLQDYLDTLLQKQPAAEADEAADETVREYVSRERLARVTDEPIREFLRGDLNHDGKKEAVAITSETVDDFGYMYANMWYVSETECERFYDGSGDDASVYQDSVKLYETEGTWLFCCVKGWGGSGRYSQVWMFDGDSAKEVANTMEEITQLSQNEFMVFSSGYDGSTDGTGYTWKPYFSHWDGEKLVEYGGLEISEEQLRKVKGASEILEAVRAYGDIQSIYYRANGMVFINLCDGTSNRNVALTLQNGVLSYFVYQPDVVGEEVTALERATGDGIIEKSVTSCVAYPEEFPLDEVKEHVMLTYMLDEPYELPATLYEGNGFSLYIPDGWTILDIDQIIVDESVRLQAVEYPVVSIWVSCYESQTVSDVRTRLAAEGYRLWDGTEENEFVRLVKSEYPLYWDARLYQYGSDIWVVFSRYDATVEYGSRLDAIADTLRVTED